MIGQLDPRVQDAGTNATGATGVALGVAAGQGSCGGCRMRCEPFDARVGDLENPLAPVFRSAYSGVT